VATCGRHPNGTRHGGLCAACLLEEALASPTALRQPERIITIQLPLGRTLGSSVFLVKSDGPVVRLLRLKTWHAAAPRGFMSRFERLQRQLSDWDHKVVAAPLAACVNRLGCASVLDEFRQGVPILEAVACGRLDAASSAASLVTLTTAVRDAHVRGLVHGSIGGGNVIVDPMRATAYLLDFGHAGLLARDGEDGPGTSADLDSLTRLHEAIRMAAPADPQRQ